MVRGCGPCSHPSPMQFFQYWPESESEVNFGSVRVMVDSESAEHLYTCRSIRLTNTKVVRLEGVVRGVASIPAAKVLNTLFS